MNTKKQYMAPASEVVDVEVHLMLNGASAGGDSINVANPDDKYKPDYDEII